jgi:3-methyladenine DNA glycosylase AlkD
MKLSCDQYIAKLSQILANNADKENAKFMKKYMKDLFPFFGIKSPLRKEIFKQFIKNEGIPSIVELSDVVYALYNRPVRELHYFAMELVDKYSRKLDDSGIKLFEHIIVTMSWWDTVDYIAAHSLSQYFKIHPGMKRPVTKQWMDSGNIWLQRSCILFQLKYKKDTDLELLYSFIHELRQSNEFFIQKAIGWILREYSKINPDEVYKFVRSTQLKPLSSREALRLMIKKGYISK